MTLMHKEGQLNLVFDLPLPHLQLFMSISHTVVGFLPLSPSLAQPHAAACRAWLYKELLSPVPAALGKTFLLSRAGGSSRFLRDWEMGTVGGQRQRPYTSPERRGRGKLRFLFPGLFPVLLMECCGFL